MSGPGSSPTGRFILGDSGSPVLRATDSASPPVIDAAATIRALEAAHINTYAYLVCPDAAADPRVSRSQWEQLPDFARRAGVAGIDVFVYLVPPTEAPEQAYEPFHWDYMAWFDQIGRIASQERSIKGIIMDDFGGNVVSRGSLGFHFTVPYVDQMIAAAHRRMSTLVFMPVLYHHDLVGPDAVLSDFRQKFQGVVFPYLGFSDGRRIRGNTLDATRALAQGVEASGLLGCPSEEGCRQIVFPARAGSDRTADFAVWASKVVPLPNERREVTFSVNDDGGSRQHSSYRIQLFVGDVSVGTVTSGVGWNERVFDITAATSNIPIAAVELRITRPAGLSLNRITVQLSNVKIGGMRSDGGFAQPARTSVGVTYSAISDIPLIMMPYARPLTAEQGRGATPAYFQGVLKQMDVLRAEGRIAGSLVFKLPLPESVIGPPSEHYQILARTYVRWLAY